jgi:thioredoxin-like negative regulator of GroEL
MAQDWLKQRRPPSVDELVAAGKYAQAAAVLRAELQARAATLSERLRLADLLVLAERGKDAVTILLEVADDLARHGLGDRALEALRRADAIQPGHADVRKRFESLARATRDRIAAAEALSHGRDAKSAPVIEPPPPPRPAGLMEAAPGGPLEVDHVLLAFVQEFAKRPGQGRERLAQALFSDIPQYLFRRTQGGLHRRHHPAGAIVLNEGDPGDSIFLLAKGSVRVLVIGGHGRALEIRRLDAPDFFGEVAALSGQLRSATVVAVSECELLEIDREALARLVEARPAAKPILEGASEGRAHSPEESVVRSLPGTASPDRADAVLAAHFGGTSWSPRVRLHLAKQMLDAGLENDALAVIASVAEELAQAGQAETAIAILKRVDQARHGERPAKAVTRAVSEASFRTWVGSFASETKGLAAGTAPSAEEKDADEKRRG